MTCINASRRNLLIGLSGPSSSGKTTVARLLREIFTIPASAETSNRSTSLTIIHQDDFYKPDAEIPTVTTSSNRTLQDWDCAEALDILRLCSTLKYITRHGRLPSDLTSKEDRNAVSGPHGVSDATVRALRDEVTRWLVDLDLPLSSSSSSSSPNTNGSTTNQPYHISLFLLDGFLLYSPPSPSSSQSPPTSSSPSIVPTPSISALSPLLPLKLFLRSTYAQTLARRASRTGYVTIQGFWEDPPGYVEEVVWPNYVKAHGWMFEGGDCDGGVVVTREKGEGIRVAPGFGEESVEVLVRWAVGEVRGGVEREVVGEVGGGREGD